MNNSEVNTSLQQELRYQLCVGIDSDKKDNLSKPYRILRFRADFPVKSNRPLYSTLKELRKNDPLWREYHKVDARSANKICEMRFIITVADVVFVPWDEEFNRVAYKLLKHTVMGELSKEINGIHLLSGLNKNINRVQEIKPEDVNGVWVADVEYFSVERDRTTYIKKGSSMFPKSWCPTTCMFEIYYAYNDLRKCDTDGYKYLSQTKSGIPVEFIIKNSKVKTVYPIYQEV